MSVFRAIANFVREIWWAIDTSNALRHGMPVSEKARQYCMPDSASPREAEIGTEATSAA